MTERRLTLKSLWESLARPHPSVRGAGRQRRTRILAGLAFGLLVLSIPLAITAALAGGLLPLVASLPVALFLASYALSRARWPEVGASLLTFGQLVLNFALLSALPNPAIVPQAIIFVLLPVLFSTLVLTAWYTIALALLAVAGLSALVAALPWLTFADVTVPYAATVLFSLLAAVAAFVRERDIATIEQQARDVDRTSQQLEAEVIRIAATAEVGQAITATRDLDDLLRQVVALITERFDFYHAQVFLVDEAGRYAVLKQSTGEVGRRLLESGHRLAVGSRSVIGQVTALGEAVIATLDDPVYRRNELLPDTRAEMALPLRVGGRVIGALDIQSTNPQAFSQSDVSVFQTMADQLAVAIENARLFEQAERDLRNIERLNRQLTGEAWREYLSGRSAAAPLGFRGDAQGVRAITQEDGEPAPQGALSLPLNVRGETIGLIELAPREDGEELHDEVRAMVEEVAERVALALDSTRLSERAQRQAVREQVLSHLSAELQGTTDLDTMLKIVAREASRTLGAPRGFVHLTTAQTAAQERAGDE